MRDIRAFLFGLTAVLIASGAAAEEADSTVVADNYTAAAWEDPVPSDTPKPELTYLVPELKGVGYSVSPGTRQFARRFSFSPGIGQLGSEKFFAFRVGYSPNSWLAYEVSFGHNPAQSLHAQLHTFNVLVRYPLPWRLQPYGTLGYGMLTVYPGDAINADPVTKNALTAGGGLELYIRDDVAVRGELRAANVLGQQLGQDGTVNYQYREYTVGFVFYRSLGR